MLTNKNLLAFKFSDGVFIMLINVKMPTLVGILTLISMINLILGSVEHEKKFYNLKGRLRIKSVLEAHCRK